MASGDETPKHDLDLNHFVGQVLTAMQGAIGDAHLQQVRGSQFEAESGAALASDHHGEQKVLIVLETLMRSELHTHTLSHTHTHTKVDTG